MISSTWAISILVLPARLNSLARNLAHAMDCAITSPSQASSGTWPQGVFGFSAVQGAMLSQGAGSRSSSYLDPAYARRRRHGSARALRSKYVSLMLVILDSLEYSFLCVGSLTCCAQLSGRETWPHFIAIT